MRSSVHLPCTFVAQGDTPAKNAKFFPAQTSPDLKTTLMAAAVYRLGCLNPTVAGLDMLAHKSLRQSGFDCWVSF